MPCHAAVGVNCVFGSNVQFLRYYAVNRTCFCAQLAYARWLLQMLLLCIAKKLCAKFYTMHRVIFLLNYPLYLVSIACFGTCLDLSQPPAFWWLTVQAGGTEYPTILFLFKGYESSLLSFLSRKRVPFGAYFFIPSQFLKALPAFTKAVLMGR